MLGTKSIMSKKRIAISSASAKLKSGIYAKAISPKAGKGKTIGIILTPSQAKELATQILAVAHDPIAKGVIHITGHKHNKNVTVLRRLV